MKSNFAKALERALKRQRRPEERETVVQLQALAEATTPHPEFAARLEGRLLARLEAQKSEGAVRQGVTAYPIRRPVMFKRLAVALTAVAVMLGLVLVIPLLTDGDDASSLPLLPRLASAAGHTIEPLSGGLLAGANLTLATELPEAPPEVPVFTAQKRVPATAEEALTWAEGFGLSGVRAYRDPREPGAVVVLAEDGRRLTFRCGGPMSEIHYGDDAAAAVTGSPLTFDEAAEVAVSFLRSHDLLPGAYRVGAPEGFEPWEERPIRAVEIVPLLDGRPVVGDRASLQIVVNPAGEVTYAAINVLAFESGESYPIMSSDAAYAALTSGDAGRPFRLDVRRTTPVTPDTRRHQPAPPDHRIGDPVDVTGWIQVLVAEPISGAAEGGGNDVRAQLTARDGTMYDLSGPRVTELREVGHEDVQVTGSIIGQIGSRHWQVAIDDWETVSPRVGSCVAGALVRDGDGVWLAPDEGTSLPQNVTRPEGGWFRLAGAPEDLSDGERVEVCADAWPTTGEDAVDWWSITAPPASEQTPAEASSSTSVVVEEVGEAPPVPTPTPLPRTHIVEEGETLSGIAGQYGVTAEALRAVNEIEELTVGQMLFIPESQALEEPMQSFLGHIELVTLEGQQVAVFTDHETDQRYVVAQSLETDDFLTPGRDPILDFDQVFVTGVVESGVSHVGLPVLRFISSQYGAETEEASSADKFPSSAPPSAISEADGEPGDVEGAFFIERVELAYYYEPQFEYTIRAEADVDATPPATKTLVQPVWVFYGRNADKSVTFTAYVQAVTEEHVSGTAGDVAGSALEPTLEPTPAPVGDADAVP